MYNVTNVLRGTRKGAAMIVEIYADIIFLINFFVNSVILYITNVLCRKNARLWRIVAGGAITALLYTVLVFTPLAGMLNIFTSFVIFAPGIWISLRPKSIKDFGITLLAAYVTTFAMGGLGMAAMYIFDGGARQIWSTYSFGMQSFTLQNLVVAVASSFVVLKFAQQHIFKKHLTKQAFCRFKIHLLDKMAELNALVDTGNSLIDPISQNPVIIAEFDKIKHLLPPPVEALFHNASQDDLAAIADGFAAGGFNTRIRMIPYSAIGKSGVILGFRPDKVEVIETGRGGTPPPAIQDVIIGICDFALSNDGEYHALMNPLLCD